MWQRAIVEWPICREEACLSDGSMVGWLFGGAIWQFRCNLIRLGSLGDGWRGLSEGGFTFVSKNADCENWRKKFKQYELMQFSKRIPNMLR